MWKFKNFFCVLLLAVSSHAATLTCNFGPSPDYQCNIMGLTPVTQVNEVITVANPPFIPYVDNATLSLSLSSSQISIQQFPTKLFDIFIRVQSIMFSYVSTSEVGTDSFYNCKNLMSINAMYSNLGNIRARFASGCYFVNNIMVSDSIILSIDEDAFVGMLSLQMMSLRNNSITCLPPRLFQPLKGLNNLDLSSNKITAIHSQLFAGLTGLNMISLMDNLIGYIPNLNLNRTGIGNGPSSLSISLSNNPIKAIHPLFMTNLFYGRLSSTTMVSINFYTMNTDNITCVGPNPSPSMTFSGDLHTIGTNSGPGSQWIVQNTTYQYSTTCYTAFTAAMASDSLVTCGSILTTTVAPTLPPGGTTNSGSGSGGSGGGNGTGGQCATDKICRYYLDWNNQYTCVINGAEGTVTSISGTHYLSFTDADLTRLYFTNSHLGKVPNVLFQKFPNLKYLHIRNSGLSVINDQTFNECGNLEFLDASDNEIFRVEETALKNCTKLKIIDLTGNEIDHVSVGLYQNDPALQRVHLRRLSDWILA